MDRSHNIHSPSAPLQTVWLLHDNKLGHIHQLKGLAKHLIELSACSCFFYVYNDIPDAALNIDASNAPQFIIGAGHKTHWQVLRLCRKYRKHGTMSCLLMTPSLPNAWFDAIIAPAHDQLKPAPHIFTTQGPLNSIEPAGQALRERNLILLGGDSKHFHWCDELILSQIESALEKQPEQTWHCFMSRRTPKSLVTKLSSKSSKQLIIEPFDQSSIESMLKQSSLDEPSGLQAMLTQASNVLLSPDSSSMLYEALSAGAKVSVFSLPEKKRLFKRSKIAQHLESLLSKGLVSSFASNLNNIHEPATPDKDQHRLQEADRAARWLLSRYQEFAVMGEIPNQHISKPLHVLQVLPSLDNGGVERGTLEIAQALKEQGLASSVASAGGRLTTKLIELGTTHRTLNLASKAPWTILKNAFLLSRLIKSQNITLMHVRSRAPAWSCLLASKLSGVPYISTFHGQYGHAFALKKFYNSAMLRGQACIAVSPFIEAHIHHEYPKLVPELTLIPRGIEPAFFNPQQCSNLGPSALDEQIMEPSKPLIFFPARFTRLKGHALIIEALSKIHTPGLMVVFAGKQSGREDFIAELKADISSRNMSHEFVFLDTLEDPRAGYCRADIVISASQKPESFGRTIAEAQAMQCLVLAAEHGAASDVLTPDFKDGLFTPNDASDLARAINHALSLDPQEKTRILKAAQQHVYQNFSLEQMCSDTIALYQYVMLANKA